MQLQRHWKKKKGFTFVEMVVSMTIISIIVLGVASVIDRIYKQMTNEHFLSTINDIARNKIQTLRDIPYDQLPTTDLPTYYGYSVWIKVYGSNDLEYSFPYDPVNFPVETITVNNNVFNVFTYIQRSKLMDRMGNNQMEADSRQDDMGTKSITVVVCGRQGNQNQYFATRVMSISQDPNVRSGTCLVQVEGRSNEAGNPVINSMSISIVEQPNNTATSYPGHMATFNIPPGQYTLYGGGGIFTSTSMIVNVLPPPNVNKYTMYFSSIPLTGLKTYVYIADHLLISQFGYENGSSYIEIFNPTDAAVSISSITSLTVQYGSTPTVVALPAGDTIKAKSFYLIADGPMPGNTVNYSVTAPLLQQGLTGGIQIVQASGKSDSVGWIIAASDTNTISGFFEGAPLITSAGMQDNVQFTRAVSTGTIIRQYTDGDTNIYGPAYDSNNNPTDFSAHTFPSSDWVPPNDSTIDNTRTVLVAGTPGYFHAYNAIGSGYGNFNASQFWCEDFYSSTGKFYPEVDGGFPTMRVEISSIPINTPTNCYLYVNNGTTVTPTTWNHIAEQYRFNGHISLTTPSTPQIITWLSATTLPPQRTFGPSIVANSLVPLAYMKSYAHFMVNNRFAPGVNMEPSNLTYIPIRLPPDPETNLRRPDFYTYSGGLTSITMTGKGANDGQATFTLDPGGLLGGHEVDISTFVSCCGIGIAFRYENTCQITGTVRSGTSASPGNSISNITINAYDQKTNSIFTTEKTDQNGVYTLKVLSDTQYRVTPELNAGQEVNEPLTGNISVDTTGMESQQTISSKDFYLNANVNSVVQGTVTVQGHAIDDGLVVFASTYSLTSPPVLSQATFGSGVIYYMTTSDSAGSYKLAIPANTPMIITSWYNGVRQEYSVTAPAAQALRRDFLW